MFFGWPRLSISLSFLTLSGHETTRRRGVEFGNDQSSSANRTSGRHMSIVHHGPIYDPLSSIVDNISLDDDPTRMSVVSCLVPATVAIAAR